MSQSEKKQRRVWSTAELLDRLDHYASDDEHHCGGDDDCPSLLVDWPPCADRLGEDGHRWADADDDWGHGGTVYSSRYVCGICGREVTIVMYGSQRDPGQCDQIDTGAGR